jgi:hypothetical protein
MQAYKELKLMTVVLALTMSAKYGVFFLDKIFHTIVYLNLIVSACRCSVLLLWSLRVCFEQEYCLPEIYANCKEISHTMVYLNNNCVCLHVFRIITLIIKGLFWAGVLSSWDLCKEIFHTMVYLNYNWVCLHVFCIITLIIKDLFWAGVLSSWDLSKAVLLFPLIE